MMVSYIIAKNTFREIIRDRILYGLVVFAIILIGFSLALGQLSFAEQVRISASFGFAAIQLAAVMVAIFAGSSLVAKEIDKKTILTLLARPITRFEFLVGKSFGLAAVVTVVVVGLAMILSIILTNLNFAFNISFFGALYGVLLESLVLLCFALFFSTFTRPAMVVCFVLGTFLIGHWINTLNYFTEKSDSATFKGFGELVVGIFPNLEVFNWRSAPIHGDILEIKTMLLATGYMGLWCSIALLGSLIIIRNKDFA